MELRDLELSDKNAKIKSLEHDLLSAKDKVNQVENENRELFSSVSALEAKITSQVNVIKEKEKLSNEKENELLRNLGSSESQLNYISNQNSILVSQIDLHKREIIALNQKLRDFEIILDENSSE